MISSALTVNPMNSEQITHINIYAGMFSLLANTYAPGSSGVPLKYLMKYANRNASTGDSKRLMRRYCLSVILDSTFLCTKILNCVHRLGIWKLLSGKSFFLEVSKSFLCSSILGVMFLLKRSYHSCGDTLRVRVSLPYSSTIFASRL